MSWLKRNLPDISMLSGVLFLNIPFYMIGLFFGFFATGVSLIVLSLIARGGD